jgi:hypothetical protein
MRGIKSYAMTNRGLHAEFPVLGRGDLVIAVLSCRYREDIFRDMGLWLKRNDDGSYRRSGCSVSMIPITYWSRGRLQQMYLKAGKSSTISWEIGPRAASVPIYQNDLVNGSWVIRKLPDHYMVADVCRPLPLFRTDSSDTDPLIASYDGRTVVQLKSRLPETTSEVPGILIIISNRIHSCSVVTDAWLLPMLVDGDVNVAMVNATWANRDLSSLQKVRKLATGTVLLDITSRRIRTKDIAIIDVLITSNRLRVAEKKLVDMLTSFSRSRALHHVRSYAWWARLIAIFCISFTLGLEPDKYDATNLHKNGATQSQHLT